MEEKKTFYITMDVEGIQAVYSAALLGMMVWGDQPKGKICHELVNFLCDEVPDMLSGDGVPNDQE